MDFYNTKQFSRDLTLAALQTMHDISSPIAILNLIQNELMIDDKNKILLKSVISQIKDITNAFFEKARNEFAHNAFIELDFLKLYEIIGQLVYEKKIQFKNRANITLNLMHSSPNIYFKINPLDLTRALSNLINNAFEAIVDNNAIDITLIYMPSWILIKIKDYGKGIPSEILPKIGELGLSIGKINGTGIGFAQVIDFIKKHEGKIEVSSEEGRGTLIHLYLPYFIQS